MRNDPDYQLNSNGILEGRGIVHREDEYSETSFTTLLQMQEHHFWYKGRHRFLLNALQASLRRYFVPAKNLSGIDLGGGCGGWIRFLHSRAPTVFSELALADSSLTALELAGPLVGPTVARYQIDLLELGWRDRWDVAFLLDVLEHIPNDVDVLRQIRDSLRPGGFLILTCPALRFFWTYNDDLARHCRRYSRADFLRLATASGLKLCQSRYFMFFLSPLLWLSRVFGPSVANMSPVQAQQLLERTHRVPPPIINSLLNFVFSAETPQGWRTPFPWGSSVLGVFRRM